MKAKRITTNGFLSAFPNPMRRIIRIEGPHVIVCRKKKEKKKEEGRKPQHATAQAFLRFNTFFLCLRLSPLFPQYDFKKEGKKRGISFH